MPTGYTAPIADGTITTFAEFALSCARAFGALIDLRDQPSDTPIPDRIEPNNDHRKQTLAKLDARLAELTGMRPDEIDAIVQADFKQRHASWAGYRAGRDARNERFRAMLKQVEAWTPPTEDHANLKRFMTEQLNLSIDAPTPEDDALFYPEPTPLNPETWLAEQIKEAQQDRDSYAELIDNETRRATEANTWLTALRDSLPTTKELDQ